MYWVVVIISAIVLVILTRHIFNTNKVYTKKPMYSKENLDKNGTCSSTCSAKHIDPVNDPDYNMQNVVKQSILLEEHLAEKNKYCKGCICKHFLHICGLSSEGVWLAENNIDKYPFLEESPNFYQKVFQKWLANKDNDTTRLEVLSLLRERRRQLIDVYFLKNTQ
jgi:hypothetical protein